MPPARGSEPGKQAGHTAAGAGRSRVQAGEMNGGGSGAAETRQTGQCDGTWAAGPGGARSGRPAEAWHGGVGLWAPSNPSPGHFSILLLTLLCLL